MRSLRKTLWGMNLAKLGSVAEAYGGRPRRPVISCKAKVAIGTSETTNAPAKPAPMLLDMA